MYSQNKKSTRFDAKYVTKEFMDEALAKKNDFMNDIIEKQEVDLLSNFVNKGKPKYDKYYVQNNFYSLLISSNINLESVVIHKFT